MTDVGLVITLALLLGWMVLSRLVNGVRRRVSSDGLLVRAVVSVRRAVLVAAVGSAVWVGLEAYPDFAHTTATWMLRGLGWGAVGLVGFLLWSGRHFVLQGLAGWIIRREQRFLPGMRIRVGEVQGRVTSFGWLSVWLVDDGGRKISLPNQQVLDTPCHIDSGRYATWSVTVRLPPAPPELARRALQDAVLTSPWVAVYGESTVLRDPEQEDCWHVRAELLDPRFGPQFEGDLLERTEEMLGGEAHLAI